LKWRRVLYSISTRAIMTTTAEHHSKEVTSKPSVLIVDDDRALGKFLCRELSSTGLTVQVYDSGEEACSHLVGRSYDLVILDLNMPGMDGLATMKQMRLSHPQLPILILTARSRTQDLVQVLEAGADDYLMKPFSFLELGARIQNLLRRYANVVPDAMRVADLVMNREERRVSRSGRRIELTPREFAILEYLMGHIGKPVSRMTLMREVWNVPFDPSTNIVDVYMKYLRDKISDAGEPKLIHTVRGVGYVLNQN
jgi:two-component system copper resistance phosphate regulon response regulator CusR